MKNDEKTEGKHTQLKIKVNKKITNKKTDPKIKKMKNTKTNK